jgi:excisionase family DNA binding protein
MPKTIDTSASSHFISLTELASVWLVSYQHVLNLISRQELPAHRVGARIIVARSDADAYLQRTRTVAPQNESSTTVAA